MPEARSTCVESQSQPQGSLLCTPVALVILPKSHLVIKQRIAELMEQKTVLESVSSDQEAENLLGFLTELYERKKKIFDDVAAELIQIEKDIKHVRSNLQTGSENECPTAGGNEEGNSVPSISLQDDLCPQPKRLALGQEMPLRVLVADETRRMKMEAYFQDIEGIYFECRKTDADPLGRFSRKLHQVTGQNILREVASFTLPESLNTSNIISSIEFDSRGQMVASGGVAKRIKVFNFDQIEAGAWSCTFPSQEIQARSKISALSWSPYLQQQLASVDYDGVLNIYDAATGQVVSHYEEHDRRAWSLDYSRVDTTRIATGSDDHRVKIWSITHRGSVCTIDGKANICSVQFSPTSANILAFGSADHNIHLYDLRFPARGLAMLQGHKKAVSYVRFMSEHELVSASTDCTLRLWNLPTADSSIGVGQSECQRTFTGHMNEKNFVGFSLNGDLISCGSESNIVYTYHRDLGQSISSFRFASTCPHTGAEVESESPAFISALCWKRNSNRMVAANSLGTIKLLELAS